ncbi:MAG TPA: hypothetical protein VKA44_07140, partial [Gemmatimonadota bacterium]|nr:hypothetical protein [Gemmatimonadota bacterium]
MSDGGEGRPEGGSGSPPGDGEEAPAETEGPEVGELEVDPPEEASAREVEEELDDFAEREGGEGLQLTGLRYRLTLLSVLVGIIAGFGAVAFRGLIALFHNLLFLGQFSFVYDANQHTPPGPWGPFVILVPVVGSVGV